MIDESFKINYEAPIFNYIEKITINDFNCNKELIIISISLFKDLKLIFVYSECVFYEKLYYKNNEIKSFETSYKELQESDVLNSFYSMLYFILSDTDSSHLDKKFIEIKSDIEFIEKTQLFILTNLFGYLKLNLYQLQDYYVFLYKNFQISESIVIVADKNKIKENYLLLNTYNEENFVIKEKIEEDKFWFFINECSKNLKDNLNLKRQLENFLLLTI